MVRALSNKTDSLPLSLWHYQSDIFFPQHYSGILAACTETVFLHHSQCQSCLSLNYLDIMFDSLEMHFQGVTMD